MTEFVLPEKYSEDLVDENGAKMSKRYDGVCFENDHGKNRRRVGNDEGNGGNDEGNDWRVKAFSSRSTRSSRSSRSSLPTIRPHPLRRVSPLQ
jgi:hypothetical protein